MVLKILLGKGKEKAPDALPENLLDFQLWLQDFVMSHPCQSYDNGLHYYELKIEQNSPLWNSLQLRPSSMCVKENR